MEVCHTSNPALILIPDISGFTKYIATSEIRHSQEKIALLLESILENNILNFKVSEIEGDAILFYSYEFPYSATEIINQCQLMFDKFHQRIDEFKLSKCMCGSCQKLYKLSLKFVLHFGQLGSVMVKDYCKLFGKDLIIAHRLLKNKISSNEYILFTENFSNQFPLIGTHLDNHTELVNDIFNLEDIGDIGITYFDLKALSLKNRQGTTC
ncbi:DUF2652 domain-containing protein [Croceitalea marina]|jgi:hypothetical protein|uniref:DUF2652 domain-containing protein n=1 Tax=Croceitalea marina TaxID=1775166 RepID=A0ABW5N1E7_9FLAO|nr:MULTISPECIES: DUF2652 domain-containing protein [Flavobacteriaceae]PIB38664.1 hypothetical protein BFP75_15425 [Maribacter sp. 4G9]|tara:strand:- start:433 stop:1062 length:630 start_codon:yes stop_codon:yes gene_type:complete